MQTIRITTSQNIDIDYEVAGVGERILARLIDFALFIVVFLAGLIVSGAFGGLSGNSVAVVVLLVIYAVLFVFYDLVCEIVLNGQSLGKRVMKIKVISLNGARPTFSQYLMRWLFRIVDFTLTSQACGLIAVAVTEKHQRVGDLVAGTTLIKTQPRTQLDNLVFTPVADSYEPVFKEAALLTDADINLIHDVLTNFLKTGNSMVVYNTAQRIREYLQVSLKPNMNSLQFLQTIIKDYSHIIAQADAL
jgi:uncharacterized RDD family membrane protein YckC